MSEQVSRAMDQAYLRGWQHSASYYHGLAAVGRAWAERWVEDDTRAVAHYLKREDYVTASYYEGRADGSRSALGGAR